MCLCRWLTKFDVRSYLSSYFFFKQNTAYVMRIIDWSSDVCSSVLHGKRREVLAGRADPHFGLRRVGRRVLHAGKAKSAAIDRRAFVGYANDQSRRIAAVPRLKQLVEALHDVIHGFSTRGQ